MAMTSQTRNVPIRISDDRLSVFLEGALVTEDLASLAQETRESLKEAGIVNIPELGPLIDTLRKAPRDGSVIAKTLLVAGTPPVPVVEPRLAWEKQYFGFAPELCVDQSSGKIDYNQLTMQRLVKPGRLLARLTEARAGVDGINVFGQPIAGGRPIGVDPRIGPNVRLDAGESVQLVYATALGRLRWDGNMLRVDEVLRVDGDANSNNGEIQYDGAVVVEGDVKAGMRVQASGDVEVHGVVEAASILAGGNLIVYGGISGRGEDAIRVKGDIHAKYILGARVECDGNVIVEKEIVNAMVVARGGVYGVAAAIVGGEIHGWRGIRAGALGSERGAQTEVVVGVDPILEDRLELLTAEVVSYQQELDRIDQATENVIPNMNRLKDSQRRAFVDLMTRSGQCHQYMTIYGREIDTIAARLNAPNHPRVHALKEARNGCNIRIKNQTFPVDATIGGPIEFTLSKGEIRHEPHPLRHDEPLF
jgi:hypothetical protein